MNIELKNKLYYNIGEVSKAFKVNSSLLRFWEKEFKELNPKKKSNGILKNFVSYDLIQTMRGDENMKIEDSEEEEEEDEDLPPLNITNEDVKIPVDKISQDMQEIAPTLTEMETDMDMNSVDQEAMEIGRAHV